MNKSIEGLGRTWDAAYYFACTAGRISAVGGIHLGPFYRSKAPDADTSGGAF